MGTKKTTGKAPVKPKAKAQHKAVAKKSAKAAPKKAAVKKEPVEVTATAFADMAGCTKANVTQWIKDGKLTENLEKTVTSKTTASWRMVGQNKMIHVENAKAELKSKLNPRQVKNESLFAFLGVDMEEMLGASKGKDDVDEMLPYEVRIETEKEQLRILTLERQKLEGSQIDRTVVEKNMEAAGLAVKTVLTGITGRVVPLVRNAATDRDAENIHAKAMEDALIQIAAELAKDMSK